MPGAQYLSIEIAHACAPRAGERSSYYQFGGPGAIPEEASSIQCVVGFHVTDVNSLFGPRLAQAWPELNGGIPYVYIGNGILVDKCMRGGTCGHGGKFGVFFHLHFETASLCLTDQNIIVELMVSESSHLRGGQWGRYCSTCLTNEPNAKVSLLAVHLPLDLLRTCWS